MSKYLVPSLFALLLSSSSFATSHFSTGCRMDIVEDLVEKGLNPTSLHILSWKESTCTGAPDAFKVLVTVQESGVETRFLVEGEGPSANHAGECSVRNMQKLN